MIWSTTSDDSLFRSFVTISPADEKILSEGTDVAGTANRGYLVSLSAHHSSGDFTKSDKELHLTVFPLNDRLK
jgi:hypothetical protein